MEAVMTSTSAVRAAPAGPVREISLPPEARALSTLARIDYTDAFRVETEVRRTAEQWARATIEEAPLAVRAGLLSGWTALGLRLGPPGSPDRVLGWEVRRRGADFVLLAMSSPLGLRGELLFRSEPHGLLFATLIQHDTPAARCAWSRITARHQRVVRALLAGAIRRPPQG
jgi:hypothetical protein